MNAVVRSVDPTQPVFNVRMMDEVLGGSVAPRRTNTQLTAIFALLALLVASARVYAVVSYGVATPSRERGIRSALGASGSRLVGMISREIVWISATGMAIELAFALVFTQTLSETVYGVDVHDGFSDARVPLVLLMPIVLAILITASRAFRVFTNHIRFFNHPPIVVAIHQIHHAMFSKSCD